ncbi:MAG TPA: thiamine pyrophosphate-dependent enzyme, partial [Dehalococcoidia bacterium]|nr:thiamine pyrophosphate-dependent enzyme [Dehalococcoidia bacterium]
HPLSLGVEGSYRRSSTMDMLEEADVALFVGSHAGGATTLLGTIPPPTTRIIHIDIDPAQPGKNMPNTLPLFGDAKVVLGQMVDAAGAEDAGANQEWIKRCHESREAWWQEHEAEVTSDQTPIRPERLAVEVAKALPDDAIVCADTGYAAAWSGAYMDLPAGKNYLACEGTLGWAFPAAIGAKVGAPDRPAVAWCGDGGFMYHMAEVETAVRNDINAIAIVLNNHALVFDTHLLQAFWSASHDVDLLSEFKETNFAKITEELGGNGIRVTDPAKIGDAVDQALHNDKLTVIDVVVDHAAVAPVAFMAGQGSRGGILSDPDKMK